MLKKRPMTKMRRSLRRRGRCSELCKASAVKAAAGSIRSEEVAKVHLARVEEKIADIVLASFLQVLFLWNSVPALSSCHHLRQGCFSRPGLGFLLPLVVEPCRRIHVVVLTVLAALEPMKRPRARSARRSRVARLVPWAFTVQAPRLPWGILLLVPLPQPRATAAAVMARVRLTTRRRLRRRLRGGGLGAGAEAESVVVVVLSRGALRRQCRPKGLSFHRRPSRRRGRVRTAVRKSLRRKTSRRSLNLLSRVCRFPGLGSGAEANWRRPCVAAGEG